MTSSVGPTCGDRRAEIGIEDGREKRAVGLRSGDWRRDHRRRRGGFERVCGGRRRSKV